MKKNDYKFILKYIEINKYIIDIKEFEFQLNSHPDFPSLLSIKDTLDFFNIENKIFNIEYSEMLNLDFKYFIILGRISKLDSSPLTLIKKEGSTFFYFEKDSDMFLKIELDSLDANFKNVCLILAENENFKLHLPNIQILSFIIFYFLFNFFLFNASNEYIILVLINIVILGLYFSLQAVYQQNGIVTDFSNSFCGKKVNNCNTVINSKKSILLKFVNFSALSLFLFVFETIFICLSINNIGNIYFVLYYINLIGIPLIFYSLYYQKVVENKWCIICLLIILTILTLLIILKIFVNHILFINIDLNFIIFITFVLYFSIILSNFIFNYIKEKNINETDKIKNIRFKRNFALFNAALKNSNFLNYSIDKPSTFIFGNRESKVEILLVINPYCGHCKNVIDNYIKYYAQFSNKLNLLIIFNDDYEIINDELKQFYNTLTHIYLNYPSEQFFNFLQNWYLNDHKQVFSEKYFISEFDVLRTKEYLESHFKWVNENEITSTPRIYINGNEYPKQYERKDIEYFINDLLEN